MFILQCLYKELDIDSILLPSHAINNYKQLMQSMYLRRNSIPHLPITRILPKTSILILRILLQSRNSREKILHRTEPIPRILTADQACSREGCAVQHEADVICGIFIFRFEVFRVLVKNRIEFGK